MEKLRWLIGDIFTELRKIDIYTAVRFENINSVEISENKLVVKYFNNVLLPKDTQILKKIFKRFIGVKDTVFLPEDRKIKYPFPVLNSKFNNFITKFSHNGNMATIEFFQKNNHNRYEKKDFKYNSLDSFLKFLKFYTLDKVELLENLYRYNQIILPYETFGNNIPDINKDWGEFLTVNKIGKFVDKIYYYL